MKQDADASGSSADGATVQQMNVRIEAGHIRLAKRLAAHENVTLGEFIDRLILAEVERQRHEFDTTIAQWQDRARQDAELFKHDVESALEAVQSDR